MATKPASVPPVGDTSNWPNKPGYDYKRFSQLTGPLQPVPDGTYHVKFVRLLTKESFVFRVWTRLISYGALFIGLGMMTYMFLPAHWVERKGQTGYIQYLDWVMLGSLVILELCRITGTFSAVWSTLKARDPLPVIPQTGLRLALVTTRVPSEPVSMVQTTLEAALRVYYDGTLDIWLLDETNDPQLRKLCKALGVRHFSRKGIEQWNQPKGRLATKTKHGNFNSWMDYLKSEDISYDYLLGVDTDQVPLPNFVERLVCYLRDPNVAFVVGPQVYGNYGDGLVPRWAESQASFFQAVIQRAGNRHGSPMFVGTNYAIKWEVLNQINGFQPCITEDMATGIAIHAARNPATGKKWRSVYTPDVLAFGEGPQSWTDYFNQQWRWAAGSFDTWKRVVWRIFFKLRPGTLLHYLLMLMYYPTTAINWVLGALSGVLYLVFNASAVQVPMTHWITLYGCSGVLQTSMYFWNRRHNVSPHEPEGSYGASGMLLSALSAPIYASALTGVLLGRKVTFVVTAKGASANRDQLSAFRKHLPWSVLLLGAMIYGIYAGHTHAAMVTWAALGLFLSLLPLILSRVSEQQSDIESKES